MFPSWNFAKLSVCPLYLVDVGFDCGDFSKLFFISLIKTFFVETWGVRESGMKGGLCCWLRNKGMGGKILKLFTQYSASPYKTCCKDLWFLHWSIITHLLLPSPHTRAGVTVMRLGRESAWPRHWALSLSLRDNQHFIAQSSSETPEWGPPLSVRVSLV